MQGLEGSRCFRRFCVRCGREVPLDRLVRGSDTCSVDCKRRDRTAQRRFQKQMALERLISSPKGRRLAAAREAQEIAKRSALDQPQPSNQTIISDLGTDRATSE